MSGLEARLLPYARGTAVTFTGRAFATHAPLPGAHATIARLVVARKRPRAGMAHRGAGGVAVGAAVHDDLRAYYATGRAPPREHVLARALRTELDKHLRCAAAVPELPVATAAFATAVDLVAVRGDGVYVVEYKTGYNGVFDTAAAGRWRATVAPQLAAAGIACTAGGHAAVQGFLGALALHATFGVPLARITVVVARAWPGSAGPCVRVKTYPLAAGPNAAAAAALQYSVFWVNG